MLKEMYSHYKRFEKYFFQANKEKDITVYYKLKHQFRSMLCHSLVSLISAIYLLIAYRVFIPVGPLLIVLVLMGFRTKAYKALRYLYFVLMLIAPASFCSSSLVLFTPIVIFMTSVQTMVQTQSEPLTWIHLLVQVIGFYFYGMDQVVANTKRMSIDELAEGTKNVISATFAWGIMSLMCMKILYSQFSSLVKKVNALKDNISKANNQLNEQNLKLQSNLEMKDVFIYTFSHELKNALNGLLGNLTLAYELAKVTQVIQHLSSAKVCGEVLNNFIHNILDSGKLENGNLEVSPERKDVMSFMQNVWSICGRIIQNKRLKGSLEIEKNVPAFLDLDEQRMIQIILNLVSNAVKFTENGQVRIRVSWETVAVVCPRQESLEQLCMINTHTRSAGEDGTETTTIGDLREFPDMLEPPPSKRESHHLAVERPKKLIGSPQCYELDLIKSHWTSEEVLSSILPAGAKGILKIQVLDSGCGISEEDQAQLFRKFSQVSSIRGQRKIGTGLGLWICKELANRLDGDIKTRSIVGIGSVFELTVRAKVSNILKRPRSCARFSNQASQNHLQATLVDYRIANTRKVLIVDDDSFNIELMKNYLNKFGIQYFYAYDGEEAVHLFKKHYKEICFVITDNFMPKKTGTEAALEIAGFLEEKRQPQIPILCISGDLKVHVGERGITSVIQKPINFDRLKEELMAVYPQLT